MNWSRAKTILIIALIITNMFLIVTYGDFDFVSDEFRDYEALAEFLAQKNIYVDLDIISKRHGDMPVLFVQNEEIDKELVRKTLHSLNPAALPQGERGDTDYITAANRYFELLGRKEDTEVFKRMAENAVISEIERDGEYTRVIYKNVVNNVTLKRSYVTFIFKNGRLYDISARWFKAVNFHDRGQRTIPATQALLLFVSRLETEKNIFINSMEMIYWLDEESVGIDTIASVDTAFPAWKIAYNETEIMYIFAYAYEY